MDDVDLFTGGLAETANIGALVGPTFGCLIGRQFHYLKRGDRYWYENDVPPSSYSRGQFTVRRGQSTVTGSHGENGIVAKVRGKPGSVSVRG